MNFQCQWQCTPHVVPTGIETQTLCKQPLTQVIMGEHWGYLRRPQPRLRGLLIVGFGASKILHLQGIPVFGSKSTIYFLRSISRPGPGESETS